MRKDFKDALKSGLPIFIGYVPPAIAFGILAKSSGVSLIETMMFSGVVFAGASQFIALNLLMTGMGFSGIILTTLLVNFRHFLMSSSRSVPQATWYLVPMVLIYTLRWIQVPHSPMAFKALRMLRS